MAKSAPKKAVAKKSASKSARPTKADAGRSASKKSAAKPVSARPSATKQSSGKKAPVKKVSTKKATTKKTATKKSPPKAAPKARAEASDNVKASKTAPATETPSSVSVAVEAKSAAPAAATEEQPAAGAPSVLASRSASGRLKVVTPDEILQTNGIGSAFSKKISSRLPVVEVSRGKEPIELHHRPLTKKDLAELRGKLEARLRELTDDVSQMQQEVLDTDRDSVSSTDAVESSSAQYEQEFTLARIESESIELSMVRRALAKMDGRIAGHEYGRCEATGIMISIERLRARPHARLCVAAVEKFEREGGGEEFGVERAQG